VTRAEWLIGEVQQHGWTMGVELGVKTGATMSALLGECPQLVMVGVDLWATCPGYEDWPHHEHEGLARASLESFGRRASLIKCDTADAAERFDGASVDFVFIDGGHSYDQVKADISAWQGKIRAGGMLCGHDANWASVKRALDECVPGWVNAGHDRCWRDGAK